MKRRFSDKMDMNAFAFIFILYTVTVMLNCGSLVLLLH